MKALQQNLPPRPRRSVLCVPAINVRALEKVHGLDCDAVIFDLEDSVAVDRKAEARDNLRRFFSQTPLKGRERIIRINSAGSEFWQPDMETVIECAPDAVLLPKTDVPCDIQTVADSLAQADAPQDVRIWAMIETPRGLLNAAAIAEAGRTQGARLDCFVVGLNDLRKETRVPALEGRIYLVPWLMQVVLAARAYGMDVIDSVSNDFKALEAFGEECAQGRAMGFDGKMLIHPAQIEAANRHFGPNDDEIRQAQDVIAAFAASGAEGTNVINSNGRMIERLHLGEAEDLMAIVAAIAKRKPGQS